jgi:hypothetical protein
MKAFMSGPTPNGFGERAQQLTRLLIDGVDVNPKEVAVDVADQTGNATSRFVMEFSSIALLHDLQEAGVQIELTDLASFVQKDVNEHPHDALSGYLEIMRAALRSRPPKKTWRLFAPPEPVVEVKWSIVSAERVVQSDAQLMIHGVAKRMFA